MSDPEVAAFAHVLRLRNGGGGTRKIVAGSVREPKAILRNFHLELELKDKKKRIDADKLIRMRNLEHRNGCLKNRIFERNPKLQEFGLRTQPMIPRKHILSDKPKMKLLLTPSDENRRSRKSEVMRKISTSTYPPRVKHPSDVVHLGDCDEPDGRLRATTLESFFPEQDQMPSRTDNLSPKRVRNNGRQRTLTVDAVNNMVNESRVKDLNRGQRLVLPDIHEHQFTVNRKVSKESNTAEPHYDTALSDRLSNSLDSLPRAPTPEPEEYFKGPPRRLQRLRSITIAQSVDIDGFLERRKARETEEKVRRRSDVQVPNLDDLELARKDAARRGSYKSMDNKNQYESEIEEAKRMLRKCRFNTHDTIEEHFDFDREMVTSF